MGVRSIAAALAVLLVASGAAALTLDQLPSGAPYTVRAIHIEGAQHVSGAARDAMLTKLPPWYEPWTGWFHKVVFNPQVFRTDLERVRRAVREAGYYQAAVTSDLRLEDDRVTIVLHVDEGPATRVEDVRLLAKDFTPTAAERAEILGLLTLESGDVFTQRAYDDSRDKLETWFQQHGYAYAKVEKDAVVDTATDHAAVTYTIARGQPAAFGATTVKGNAKVSDELITRELQYRPGDQYDPRQIDKTQQKVFGLHLFRSVVAKPTNLDTRSGVIDMEVRVAEGPPREVKIGVGYGLEDGPRGQLRWQDYDFLGGGRQLGFRVKGSLITQEFGAEFRQPFFLAPRQTFVLPLTQTREDEPAFTLARVRLAPHLERELAPGTRAAFGYDIEYDDTSNVPDETKRRIAGYMGRGIVSSLTGSIERNTTLDLLDPHQGSVLSLEVEQAGGPWGGDFSFYRAVLEAKKYVPVYATRVIAGRFRIGSGDGFGGSHDLPIFRRFFAGGINSTRGYGRYKIGPLTPGGTPIGGRSLLEWNLEFRTPIYGAIGGVVFLDGGEVREPAFSYTLRDFQLGVGFGVRYHTPIGPLRFDLGFPLDRPRGEPGWQVHFSIGQAF